MMDNTFLAFRAPQALYGVYDYPKNLQSAHDVFVLNT